MLKKLERRHGKRKHLGLRGRRGRAAGRAPPLSGPFPGGLISGRRSDDLLNAGPFEAPGATLLLDLTGRAVTRAAAVGVARGGRQLHVLLIDTWGQRRADVNDPEHWRELRTTMSSRCSLRAFGSHEAAQACRLNINIDFCITCAYPLHTAVQPPKQRWMWGSTMTAISNTFCAISYNIELKCQMPMYKIYWLYLMAAHTHIYIHINLLCSVLFVWRFQRKWSLLYLLIK